MSFTYREHKVQVDSVSKFAQLNNVNIVFTDRVSNHDSGQAVRGVRHRMQHVPKQRFLCPLAEWLVPAFLYLIQSLGSRRQECTMWKTHWELFVNACFQCVLNRKSHQSQYLKPDIFDNNLWSRSINLLILSTGMAVT